MNPKIDYDPKVNILSIKLSQKKSVDSDVQKNIILDYAKNGDVTNIDIMDINMDKFLDLNLALYPHPMRQQISLSSLTRVFYLC